MYSSIYTNIQFFRLNLAGARRCQTSLCSRTITSCSNDTCSTCVTMAMYSPSILPDDDDPARPEARDDDVDDEELPSEAQLVLLCLDHLRDLRRSYSKEDLLDAEGMDAHYLSVAIYALSRTFVRPPELTNTHGNDSRMDRERANQLTPGLFPVKDPKSSKNFISIPNLNSINQEIFYTKEKQAVDEEEEEEEYAYDDGHASNAHRFYPLDGLASGPSLRGPLTLGEIAVAGLAGLGARSRLAAELDVRESPLFDQFVSAVRSKGFFKDPETETPRKDPEEEKERLQKAAELEEERLGKVMGKVRTKLANKAQQQLDDHVGDIPPLYDDYLVMSAAERFERRRLTHMEDAERIRSGEALHVRAPPRSHADVLFHQTLSSSKSSPRSSPNTMRRHSSSSHSPTKMSLEVKDTISHDTHGAMEVVTSSTLTSRTKNVTSSQKQQQREQRRAAPQQHDNASPATPSTTKMAIQSPRSAPSPPQDNPADINEAERLKTVGNTHMQRKEYVEAAEAYTDALTLSPNGPYTHVYYSNRAAALLSMKKFDQAIADSERSLALKPDYGKAHARLGLAHFLLGNYRLAVEAYTISLKYEPDNKSTKNYLEKAAKRAAALDDKGGGATSGGNVTSSFSFVSEIERADSARRLSKMGNQVPTETEDANKKLREKDAERLKLRGNSHMANRDYEAALKNYTAAVKMSPDGPNSHVYYSNRAAALCYLERYEEAEADSEHSLMLVPTYGKAHARLGLSRFFMGDYTGAIDAYTAALEFDPENAASRSYLAKARARLAKQQQQQSGSGEGHRQSSSSKTVKKKERRAPEPVATSPASSNDSLDEIMNAGYNTPRKDATAAEI